MVDGEYSRWWKLLDIGEIGAVLLLLVGVVNAILWFASVTDGAAAATAATIMASAPFMSGMNHVFVTGQREYDSLWYRLFTQWTMLPELRDWRRLDATLEGSNRQGVLWSTVRLPLWMDKSAASHPCS